MEDEEYVCKICVKRRAAQKAKQRQRAKLAAQKANEEGVVAAAGTPTKTPSRHTPIEMKSSDGVKRNVLVPVALMRVEENSTPVKVEVKEEPMDVEDNEMTKPEPMETDLKDVNVVPAKEEITKPTAVIKELAAATVDEQPMSSSVSMEDTKNNALSNLLDTPSNVEMEDLEEEEVKSIAAPTVRSEVIQDGSGVGLSEGQVLPKMAAPSQTQQHTPLEMSIPSPVTKVKEAPAFNDDTESSTNNLVDKEQTGMLHRTVLDTAVNIDLPAGQMSVSEPHKVVVDVCQAEVTQATVEKDDQPVADSKEAIPVSQKDERLGTIAQTDPNVNQSEVTLSKSNPELVVHVEQILEETGLPSSVTVNEIVESVSVDDVVSVKATKNEPNNEPEGIAPVVVVSDSHSRTFGGDFTLVAQNNEDIESKGLMTVDKGVIPSALVNPVICSDSERETEAPGQGSEQGDDEISSKEDSVKASSKDSDNGLLVSPAPVKSQEVVMATTLVVPQTTSEPPSSESSFDTLDDAKPPASSEDCNQGGSQSSTT